MLTAPLQSVMRRDHRVAVLELDEATVHRAACQDETGLAFAAVAIPAENIRECVAAHDVAHSDP